MKLIKDKKDVFTIPNMLSAFRIILAAVFLSVLRNAEISNQKPANQKSSVFWR